MDNFVVITHYQLFHAIVMILNSKRPSRIYIYTGYIYFDIDKLQYLEGNNFINEIVFFDDNDIKVDFFKNLPTSPSNFEAVLVPFFERIFCNITADDDIYVYNELQLSFYYLATRFTNIIKVEDGYNSFIQEHRIHNFTGRFEMIDPYIGNVFPGVRGKRAKKVIVSSLSKEEAAVLDDDILEKIEIIDYLELKKAVFDKMKELIPKLYEITPITNENSLLILTQPLYKKKYCSPIDQMLFYKQIIQQHQNEFDHIYIKKHPADKFSYLMFENEQIKILAGDTPIDVYEFTDYSFEKAISHGSTTSNNKAFRSVEKIIGDQTITYGNVAKTIKNYIGKCKLDVNIFCLIEPEVAVPQIIRNYRINLTVINKKEDISSDQLGEYNILIENSISLKNVIELLKNRHLNIDDTFAFVRQVDGKIFDKVYYSNGIGKVNLYSNLSSRKPFCELLEGVLLSTPKTVTISECTVVLNQETLKAILPTDFSEDKYAIIDRCNLASFEQQEKMDEIQLSISARDLISIIDDEKKRIRREMNGKRLRSRVKNKLLRGILKNESIYNWSRRRKYICNRKS